MQRAQLAELGAAPSHHTKVHSLRSGGRSQLSNAGWDFDSRVPRRRRPQPEAQATWALGSKLVHLPSFSWAIVHSWR